MSKPAIVGIDLGTTNSCISIMQDNVATIIENQEGQRTTPSVINISGENVIVGKPAQRKLLTDPEHTIFNVKRLIGRKYADVKEYTKRLPFSVIDDNGELKIKVDDKRYEPAKLSSFVLSKLRSAAESFLSRPVKFAVITVPAYFNHTQREETKKAGELAGLKVLRVLNEPTSAALNHAITGHIAVYDLGGGTFDISILEKSDNIFEVKATAGDSFLGGDDIDNTLTDFLMERLKNGREMSDIDLAKIRPRIKKAAESAKKELSTQETVTIDIPYAYKDTHFTYELKRAEFEDVVAPLIKRTVKPCLKALKDANIDQVDHLVLVGGMTRMPLVRKLSEEIFNRKPLFTASPDESVAQGAAIQAAILSGDVNKLLLDVTSLSLGIETVGGLMSTIVKRNSTLPLKKSSVFTTSEDNQEEVIVNIYQGESENVKDNCFLGKIILKDIKKAPKGVPRIEVGFEADVNGIYRVTAKDLLTGREQSAEVTGIQTKEKDVAEKMQDKVDEKDEMVDKNDANKSNRFFDLIQSLLSKNSQEVVGDKNEEIL
ncbi:Molecular chaperones mortalin/PBP74/GRP75, HSP70 superfamily [Trachipleistophora hominis]|uniref:Mitochondrial-like Hsp70 n=1 Tax=Trachipleistophora hominis TaxID=72359 RepID=Q8MV55_TRAHO|nr:mitochondrial-like Hsp70 [Trachipleistophora hominis]ELQ74029.1 Molecular chaperones mortalin/PBP74/GRP75, HSP70 superfamily [Trachipleistophora hominis]